MAGLEACWAARPCRRSQTGKAVDPSSPIKEISPERLVVPCASRARVTERHRQQQYITEIWWIWNQERIDSDGLDQIKRLRIFLITVLYSPIQLEVENALRRGGAIRRGSAAISAGYSRPECGRRSGRRCRCWRSGGRKGHARRGRAGRGQWRRSRRRWDRPSPCRGAAA